MEVLPEWCAPLYDAEGMRSIDRWAIEQQGMPSLDLMERAGEAVARAVERICPDGPVAVVCGKGNNGGDGLVAARLLRDHGRPVRVISLAQPEELSHDARESLVRLPGEAPVALVDDAGAGGSPDPSSGEASQRATPISPAAAAALSEAAVVLDALLGTGFSGKPRGRVLEAIEAIGRARRPVLSVDVPSGVDASSGAVAGAAVRAAATVTFHAGKAGLWIHPGKGFAGEVEIVDIGIPRGAPSEARVGLIGEEVLLGLPRRGRESTKFSSGHVLVVGGSPGLTGAPRLAGEGAMRAGAGYVTVCVPGGLQAQVVSAGRAEMMTRGLAESGGHIVPGAVGEVERAAERGGSVALGSGLGRGPGVEESARDLARRMALPMVVDADGLNAHAGRLEELRGGGRGAARVLTPHAGELGRLLGCGSAEVQARRLECARLAARTAGAVVVLKGDDTLVVDPGGLVGVSRGGSPALATAGTGDVLAGVVAALLAQGLQPFEAACAGVVLHLRAGRIAAGDVGCAEGVVAGDVIGALPRARTGDGA